MVTEQRMRDRLRPNVNSPKKRKPIAAEIMMLLRSKGLTYHEADDVLEYTRMFLDKWFEEPAAEYRDSTTVPN